MRLTRTPSGGDELDEQLFPLGVIDELPRLGSAIAVARAAPERAAKLLRLHRVVGLGLRRIEESSGPKLDPPLAALRSWRRQMDAVLNSGLDDLQAAVESTAIPTAVIKGLAMREHYARPEFRDLGDIDIMVDTVDDAWILATDLRSRGYDWCQYELPWIKRWNQTHEIYGQFQVWRRIDRHYVRVDIHFGGYSVRATRRAACGPIEPGLGRTKLENNLVCIVANGAGDGLIRMKDVNDVLTFIHRGGESLTGPLERLRVIGLGPYWNSLVEKTEAIADLPATTRKRLHAARLIGVRHERPPFGEARRLTRLSLTVRDAFAETRSHSSAREAGQTAAHVFRYYRSTHSIRTGPCEHHLPLDPISSLGNVECVRLIPPRMIELTPVVLSSTPVRRAEPPGVPLQGSELLRVVDAGGHTLLVAEDEVLIPTIWYDICRTQVDRGLDLAWGLA